MGAGEGSFVVQCFSLHKFNGSDILDRSKITRSLTCIQYRAGSEINVFAMGIVW